MGEILLLENVTFVHKQALIDLGFYNLVKNYFKYF